MTQETFPAAEDRTGDTIPDADTEQDEKEVSEEIQDKAGSTHPTSSDVGKQTLTKADLGYDVTKEGVPPDEEAMVTPQHPDDPSADEETERNPGMAGSESK